MEKITVPVLPDVTPSSGVARPPSSGVARPAPAVSCAFSANSINHAPLLVWLARELDFNQTQAGHLTAAVFLSHAALQVPGGHLADRLGPRRWSGAFLLTAALAAAAWVIWIALASHTRRAATPAMHISSLLFRGELWLPGLVQMASFGVAIVTGAWIAVLLGRSLHIPPGEAGTIGSLVLPVGIFARLLVGGPLAGRLVDLTGSFRSSFVALGAFTFITCVAVFFLKNEPSPVI